jgi:hypothetical protein
MQLAVNYSPVVANLIRDGVVEVDRLKCPEMPELIAAAQEVRLPYVHFAFRAGRGLDGTDWAAIERLLAETNTPHVNAHLSPCADDFDGLDIRSAEADDRLMLARQMTADLSELVRRFGRGEVFGENLMWAPAKRWRIPQIALEPGVIRHALDASGAGLLLDLAHATVASRWLGMDVRDYIAGLPVDRLGEIHVSGVQLQPDGLWEDHHSMTDFDWDLLRWAVDRLVAGDWRRPALVSFEYGGAGKKFEGRTNPAVLAEQLPRLREEIERAV